MIAPNHYQVISNGLLVEETNLNKELKKTHWKQSVPISCWLYALGVAEFAVDYVDYFEGKSIQTGCISKIEIMVSTTLKFLQNTRWNFSQTT
ncbi:MAG: hypothetical protein CM15mP75_1420 [Flammeovirgaceae bacterium]|nr:MAG: hypothetical protein CM15mP75_1420 [Flammeovirgaceae bacterium]